MWSATLASPLVVTACAWQAVFGKLPVAWTETVSTNPLEAQYQLPTQILVQVRAPVASAGALRPRAG